MVAGKDCAQDSQLVAKSNQACEKLELPGSSWKFWDKKANAFHKTSINIQNFRGKYFITIKQALKCLGRPRLLVFKKNFS